MQQIFYTDEEARLNIDVNIEPLHQSDEKKKEGNVFEPDDWGKF